MRISVAGLRILLGITFLFSAYTKFVGPGFFEITLMDQGLAPDRFFAAQLAQFFIGLEFALGILMLLPFYTKKLMLISLLLLGGFTLHLVYLWSIGDTENCGCFGEMISMTPLESIIKNGILIGISAFVFWKTANDKRSIKPILLETGLIIASMWLLLPLPNHSDFPFQKLTQFEYAGRVDLAAGEKVVAVFNLNCEHCQEAATQLAELAAVSSSFPKLYVLFYQEGSTTVAEFEELTAFAYPYAFIDINTFFDLIGNSPPRIYHLKAGKVEAIWDEDFISHFQETFELN
ncbi:MAG: hypothetical protein MUQ86_06630 [Flavobacteriaceae bacterium]|nr:hypothetical protein [Flavobacteriaceae bacterium]